MEHEIDGVTVRTGVGIESRFKSKKASQKIWNGICHVLCVLIKLCETGQDFFVV
jgi:hypothetical protein